MDAIVGCVGPLAKSARDIELFCRVMLDSKPWLVEPPLLEMPWRRDIAKGEGLPQKLTIAILFDDGIVMPHPPITSKLHSYKHALIAAGHDVIEWEPLDHQKGWDLIVSCHSGLLVPNKRLIIYAGEIIPPGWRSRVSRHSETVGRTCCAADEMDA